MRKGDQGFIPKGDFKYVKFGNESLASRMGQTSYKNQLASSLYGPKKQTFEVDRKTLDSSKFEATKTSVFEKGGPINHKTGKLLNRPFSGYKPATTIKSLKSIT